MFIEEGIYGKEKCFNIILSTLKTWKNAYINKYN